MSKANNECDNNVNNVNNISHLSIPRVRAMNSILMCINLYSALLMQHNIKFMRRRVLMSLEYRCLKKWEARVAMKACSISIDGIA